MVRNITTLETEPINGVTVQHPYFYHRPAAKKLLIVLPGRGYTTEHPVLYYLRKMAVELLYDVLSVQYSFHAAPYNVPSTIEYEALQAEALLAINEVRPQAYEHICIAGKSLGSVLASRLSQTINARSQSLLLLTPVGDAVDQTGQCRTLAIIGTADSAYDPLKILEHANHPHLKWRTFEGLNHGLEVENNWDVSIAALGEITAACAAFLR